MYLPEIELGLQVLCRMVRGHISILYNLNSPSNPPTTKLLPPRPVVFWMASSSINPSPIPIAFRISTSQKQHWWFDVCLILSNQNREPHEIRPGSTIVLWHTELVCVKFWGPCHVFEPVNWIIGAEEHLWLSLIYATLEISFI